MSWVNIQYESNLRKKDKRDGMKALAVYCLIMCSAFFQGWLYTTNAKIFVLNLSQIWIPLILTAGFFWFFYCSKGLGLAGGFLLLTIQTVLFMIQGKSISFTSPQLLNWVIFLFAAFEEEVLFRGYIQTRLSGLISSQWIVGIINSVLFLSIHYPVRWVVSGAVSFDVLSAVYIISLLALHFFCDAVYKRTNCLWGAVILHIIYNAVGVMIIIQ